MVLFALLGLGILGFFVLSIFDRELRDRAVDKLRGVLDNLFKKSPVIADQVIIDPLTEQVRKLTSGRKTGGIQVDQEPARSQV